MSYAAPLADMRFVLEEVAGLVTMRFYAEHFLALASGYLPGVVGGSTVLDFDLDRF